MIENAVVVYRGPLGRSRLGFLLEAITRAYGETTFLWACPKPVDSALVDHFQAFVGRIPLVTNWEILPGTMRRQFAGTGRIRWHTRGDVPVIAAGFTTLHLLAAARRRATVYAPTGIPEERLLNGRSMRNVGGTAASWALLRTFREPQLTLTVSSRMSNLFKRRTGWSRFDAVPLCVDRSIFQPGENGERMAYLGTGAPWQQVGTLAETWRELVRIIPTATFRVISRDERTHTLLDAVGPDRCDVVEADQPEQVAYALRDCRVGFVLRGDHIVNRVAYPTKIGEYLASGMPIVTTDLDWDAGDLLRDLECGALLSQGASAAQAAEAVRALLARDRAELAKKCAMGAEALDRDSWVRRLASRLPSSQAAM